MNDILGAAVHQALVAPVVLLIAGYAKTLNRFGVQENARQHRSK